MQKKALVDWGCGWCGQKLRFKSDVFCRFFVLAKTMFFAFFVFSRKCKKQCFLHFLRFQKNAKTMFFAFFAFSRNWENNVFCSFVQKAWLLFNLQTRAQSRFLRYVVFSEQGFTQCLYLKNSWGFAGLNLTYWIFLAQKVGAFAWLICACAFHIHLEWNACITCD